jgi:tetratricopeptide (TPR) repeat protein
LRARIVVCCTILAAMVCAPAAVAQPAPRSAASRPQPASFDDLAHRADAARMANRCDEAIALYKQGLAIQPSWVEGRWNLAACYFESKQFADARETFRAVADAQPLNGPAWGFVGLSEYHLNDYESALANLVRARDIGFGPNKDLANTVRYHVGILMTRFEQFEYALKTLAEFVNDGNDSPSIIEAMGLATLRMPLLPDELPEAQREPVLLAGRASYYLGSRLIEPARRTYEELIQRFPDTPNVHFAYGIFFLNVDRDRAIEQFELELRRWPSSIAAHLQLAFEYIQRSDWARVRQHAEQALAIAPDRAPAHLALGQALLELGDVDKSISELEAALRLSPENPLVHFTLARAYQRAGRAADAERERAEFTRLDREARASQQGSQSLGGSSDPSQARPPR